MDWDKLKTFHAAAEAGSLTGAAEALNLSQSAVSRQISALETDMGLKLFHRHARGLIVTEPGRILHETTRQVSTQITFAEVQVQDCRDEPSGLLRVTAPTALGALWIAPRLTRFKAMYPSINLRLIFVDNELDLANLEADCAVRPWASSQNDLIQRKVMEVPQHLYGSEAYFARLGEPKSLADLDSGKHDLITYGPRKHAPLPNLNWILDIGRSEQQGPRTPAIEINTINGMVKLAEAGLGLTGLPDYVARENAMLKPVLPDLLGPPFEIFFVYPNELKGSRRIAAFREFLMLEIKNWDVAQL